MSFVAFVKRQRETKHAQLRVEKARVSTLGFTVDLPKPLSVNNLYINNPKTHGRFPSPEYRAWKKEAAQMLMAQRARCAIGPVEITITIGAARGDLDNRLKCCIDCLVENGIIDGDTHKTVRKITAQWGDVVGALVEIRPAESRLSATGKP